MTLTEYVAANESRLRMEMKQVLDKQRKMQRLIRKRFRATDDRERQALRVKINSLRRAL